MSRTLNLCKQLFIQGDRYQSLGVDNQALRIFTHLTRLRELPKPIAEETQFHLAELLVKQGNYAKARRHLTAALAHDPDNAEYHFLMAFAHQHDPKGNRDSALAHYRACIQLDKDDAIHQCDAGIFAVENGAVEDGLDWLRRAVELAPNDPEIVGEVVRCLQDNGHEQEAMRIARTARFQNCRDPRFQALWNDFRFQELRLRQQQAEKAQSVRWAAVQGSVCLPFLQLTVETATGRKLVRRDGPSGLPPSHLRRSANLSDKRHA